MAVQHYSKTSVLRVLKWIVLGGSILTLLMFIGLFWVITQKREWIINQLMTAVNSQLSGEIVLEKADVAWRFLPRVAIEANQVKLFEHNAGTRSSDEEPILLARKLYVVLDAWTLLADNALEISSGGVHNAQLNLIQDSAGVLNITRAFRQTGGPSHQKGLTLLLEEIDLDSVLFTWTSPKRPRSTDFLIHEMTASLSYAEDSIKSVVRSRQEVQGFYLMNRYIAESREISSSLDLLYMPSRQRLVLHTGKLALGQLSAVVSGSYDHQQGQALVVDLDGSSSGFVLLKALIKEKVIGLNKDLLRRGSIELTGKIYGSIADGPPQFDCSIRAKDIDLTLPERFGKFRNISFECSFQSGKADDLSGAVLDVSKLTGEIPGGSVTGRIRIRNLVNPAVSYRVNAKARLDAIEQVFRLKHVKGLQGTVSVNSNFEGQFDFSNVNPANPVNATVLLEKVAFTLVNSNRTISGLNGTITLANHKLTWRDFQFSYDSSRFQVDGDLSNPYQLVFNHEAKVEAKLRIASDKMFTSDLALDTLRVTSVLDTAAKVNLGIEFSSTVGKIRNSSGIPDFSFRIGRLSADLKKHPDIIQATASGEYLTDSAGVSLRLDDFSCWLTSGTFSVNGKSRWGIDGTLQVQAGARINQVPVAYFIDFARSLEGGNPQTYPYLDNMKSLTTELELDAWLTRKPALIKNLQLAMKQVNLSYDDTPSLKASRISLRLWDTAMKNDSIGRVKSINCQLDVDKLLLPEIGATSVHVDARGDNPTGPERLLLDEINVYVQLPSGSLSVKGELSLSNENVWKGSTRARLRDLTGATMGKLNYPFGEPDKVPDPSFDKFKIHDVDIKLAGSVKFEPLMVHQLELKESRVDFSIGKTRLQSGMFSLNIDDLSLARLPDRRIVMKSLKAKTVFDSLNVPYLGKTALQIEATGENDKVVAGFTTNALRGESEHGTLDLDISGKEPEFRLQYSVSRIPTRTFSRLIKSQGSLDGLMDVELDVRARGIDASTLDRLDGKFSAVGKDLKIIGIDIDKFLKNYKKSQNFNLVDVGAFVIAGPAGPLVTKGSDFARLLATSVQPSDTTLIAQLATQCRLSGGHLTTEDVAFATTSNRIVLIGDVDYANDTIPGVKIGVVDKSGCSLLDQRFYGRFDNMKQGKLKIAGTLTGSLINLANAVADKDCKPIYKGSVTHPGKVK